MNNRIKEIIENKGYKTSSIIEKTGLARSSFYDIMNGKQVPRLDTAYRIAEVFEVSLNELFPIFK